MRYGGLRGFGLLVCGLFILSGCSSDDSEDDGDPIDIPCALYLPVSGGLEGTLVANGCGTSSLSLTLVDWNTSAGNIVTVGLMLNEPIEPGVTGAAALDTILIRHDANTNSTTDDRQWETPLGACSVTILANEASPTEVFPNRHLLDGEGSCSEPAAPLAPTVAEAVTLADFTFSAFIDP
jgi:hypothetical protein